MASSSNIRLKIKKPGRIWPSDELAQERTEKTIEEDIDLERILSDLKESFGSEEDLQSIAVLQGEDIRENSDVDSFQEIAVKSLVTSHTIVDLKLSLHASTLSNGFDRNYAAAVSSERRNRTERDTSHSLPLNCTHHVTKAVVPDIEEPVVPITGPEASLVQESEEVRISVTEEIPVATQPQRCSNWYCPHGKSPVQLTSLVSLYLVLGVVFFPLLLIVFMICCVSFFTPDIE